MIMEEYFPKQKYTVLATDCDKDILNKAREGVYIAKSMQNVSEQF